MEKDDNVLCRDPNNPSNVIVYRAVVKTSRGKGKGKGQGKRLSGVGTLETSTTTTAASISTNPDGTPDFPRRFNDARLVRLSVPAGDGVDADSVELGGRRVLIVVNPKAGRGSRRVVSEALRVVRQLLGEAGLSDTDIITRHTEEGGHATRLVADELDRDGRFGVVLAFGGDGTLYEVVNGLLRCASGTPVVPVPIGTGNAVAVSMGIGTVEHAAVAAIRGLRRSARNGGDVSEVGVPVCLLRFRQGVDGSSGNGNISSRKEYDDVDNHDHGHKSSSSGNSDNDKSTAVTTNTTITTTTKTKTILCGVQWGFPAEVDQGTEGMRWMGDARYILGTLGQIAAKKDYSARIVIDVHPEYQTREYKNDAVCTRNAQQYTLDGRFVMVVAWNCQAIAKDSVVTPWARMTETDAFDVVLVPSEGMTRLKQLQVFAGSEDGSFLAHADRFNIKYFKATRVVFERLDGKFLTADGEVVPLKPFTLDIAPESGSVRMFQPLPVQA